MKSTHIILFLAMAAFACSVEKQSGTLPDKEARVLEYLQQGFSEGNLSVIPFDLNFHDLKPGPDDDVVFYQTMFKERLFLPPDNQLADVEAGKDVALTWEKEAAKVGVFLKKIETDPFLSLYKQECARGMITKTNLLADTTGAAATELGKWVNILIHEQSYAPGLVAYGLHRLQKTWPDQHIARAVNATLSYRSEVINNYNTKIALLEKSPGEANADVLTEFKEIRRQNEIYFSRLSGLVH